jgi:hypothetical protein
MHQLNLLPNQCASTHRFIGQKAPLKLQEVWAIRIRLQISNRFEIWRYSTSASIASSEDVIWSKSE